MATAKPLVEKEVWMRLEMHSSGWQGEARWASGKVRWALEMAGDAEGRLLGHTVYDAKVLGSGQDQVVALVAQVLAPSGMDEFDEAAEVVLGALDDGFEEINRLAEENRHGHKVSYTGGAEEYEGEQYTFAEHLKAEFAIEPAPAQPLTPQQVAFRERAAARQRALQANLIELFAKPEEPGI